VKKITSKLKFSALMKKKTPFYAWDLDVFHSRIHYILNAFSCIDNFRLFYAMKANPSPIILQSLLDQEIGVDVCSVQELKLALKVGIKPNRISLCPFVPSVEELKFFSDSGCNIDLDSIEDLKLWAKLKAGSRQIGLRVNPDVKAGFHSHCSSGLWSSKFGIPIDELQNAFEIARNKGLSINGLHIHIGSSSYDPKPYIMAIEKIFRFITEQGLILSYINIGGGWGVPFSSQDEFETHEHFPLNEYAKSISNLMDVYQISKTLEIRAEPGEYIVGPCGFLVCKVRRILFRTKNGKRHKIAVLDGGSYLYPGPSLYGSDNYIILLNRDEHKKELQILAGRSMLAGDIFGPERKLASLEPGDIIAIGVAGAYSQIKSTNFNLLPKAKGFSL